jgi:protein-L-isoaspartate(D-aspartate) O-methyltransferase
MGWQENAPFDAIITTAGGPEVPPPLVEQLAENGRMIIPVGNQDVQELQLVTKTDGEVHVERLERVRFVDLIGKHGWPE